MSFFTGFGVSSLVYIALNYVFPVPGRASSFKEVDLSHQVETAGDRSVESFTQERSDSKDKLEYDTRLEPVQV